jgi:hypothetical protein
MAAARNQVSENKELNETTIGKRRKRKANAKMKVLPRISLKTRGIQNWLGSIHLQARMYLINKPLIAYRPECY